MKNFQRKPLSDEKRKIAKTLIKEAESEILKSDDGYKMISSMKKGGKDRIIGDGSSPVPVGFITLALYGLLPPKVAIENLNDATDRLGNTTYGDKILAMMEPDDANVFLKKVSDLYFDLDLDNMPRQNFDGNKYPLEAIINSTDDNIIRIILIEAFCFRNNIKLKSITELNKELTEEQSEKEETLH